MEFGEVGVTHQMRPGPAVGMPGGRVDEHGHVSHPTSGATGNCPVDNSESAAGPPTFVGTGIEE
jgi:hypothetical protein